MAVAPIVIDLLLKGTPAIAQGMRNVADTVAKSQKQMTKDAEREAKQRQKLVDQEARDKVRAMVKMDGEVRRIQDQEARNRQRVLQGRARDEERAARETVRFERQATTEVERIQERARRNASRAFQQEQRDRSRAIAERVRQEEAAARTIQAGRERMARAFVGAAGRGVSAGLQRAGGFAARTAGIAAQLGGGFSLADSLQGTANLQRSAALLANSAIGVNGVTSKEADPAKIIARARAASVTTGIDAKDLVEATRSYVAKSSDFSGGMANMEFFGQLSKSTGTDIGDITKAMGLIRSQNKDLDAEGAKSMLRAVVMQGKQGSVELEDLANSAGKITRSATSYAGDQSVNQQKLLGLSQIAVRTAGSTDSAAIALSSLGSDTRNHADSISRTLGYKVLDAHGAITKAPEQLLSDLMGATGGNLKALGQHGGLGFTKPTMKIFEALAPEFKRAEAEYLKAHPNDAKGARAAGAQASLKEMNEITGQTLDQHGITDMFKRVMSTPAEQFEDTMRDLRQTVGEQLLPEFVNLIPTIKDMTPALLTLLHEGVPAMADIVKTIADLSKQFKWLIGDVAAHPVGALIALEIGKAAIPQLVGNALTKLLAGGAAGGAGGAGGAGAGAAGAGAGVGSAGAALGGTAMATYLVATKASAAYGGGEDEADLLRMKLRAYGQGDHEYGVSPEVVKKRLAMAQGNVDTESTPRAALALLASPLSSDADKEYTSYKHDKALVENEALKAALKEVAAALNNNSAAVRNSGGSGSNSGPAGPARTNSMLDR